MSATEFLECIKIGDVIRAKRLIQEKRTVAKSSFDGVSALLLSVYYGATEIQQEIEKTLGDDLDIHEAAAVGNAHILQGHINLKPDRVNEFSNDGYFPLGYACFFGHADCVELLLDAGAEVNQHASNQQNVAPIHAAVANGDIEIVELVIKAGANVNAAQTGGFRPLHTAASENKVELARILLLAGADPALENDIGTTPAQLAEQKGHSELAAFLKS